MSMSQLMLYFLGPWHATLAGTDLVHFRYDRARALLAYLAVEEDRPHRREALMGLLWPDLPETAARNNLRQVLHALREALGDRHAQSPYILASRATLQFNPDADYELDVRAFVDGITASERHAHRSAEGCHSCARRLREAVALYRAPFLADFYLSDSVAFEEWALVKREWLNQLMLSALTRLAAYYERRGQYEEARRYAQKQLALEPWREATHRAMMRLYVLEDDRAAALAQYEQCRRLLDDELGVAPEPATSALYQQIRDASEEMPLGLQRLAVPARRPHTLPPPPTPFLGREAELAEIGRLIGDEQCRLLTLTGPAGIGKSRLALQAAAEQLDAFTDGVFFVPLAAVPSASLLPSTLVTALGLEDEGDDGSQTWLLERLRDRELLLLVDNFEHLLAGADLLSQILRAAPNVTLLVTSRERLNLQGEWVLAVNGLPCPQPDEREAGGDAVDLFDQSARRARHDFTLSTRNREQVGRICRLVAGLPLAIELAAAWVQTLSCAEIAAQIDRDIAFLTTNLRDLPERHRSLLAVFEHTWRGLAVHEQSALSRLSVFRGGFRHGAAAEVAGATLDLLRQFVDKSLLQRDAAGRYRFHELLQRYAAERLEAAGEVAATQQHHLSFFLQLAERASSQLRGPESAHWLARLEAEHDNLQAALDRGLSGSGELLNSGLGLTAALWPFWYRRGHLVEGRQRLGQALNHENAGMDPALVAALHHGAGVLAWNQGDYAAAYTHYERSLRVRRRLGDEQGVAALLNNLGNLALDQGNYTQARTYLEESLALKRRTGNTAGIASSLSNLGVVAYEQADYTAASAYLEESISLKRSLGDHAGAAIPLGTLGAVAIEQGEFGKARALLEESLRFKREVGDRWGIAMTLADLAVLALRQEAFASARRLLAESLDIRQQLGDRWSLAHALQTTAYLAAAEGQLEQAVRLWGAAAALRAEIGTPMTGSNEQQFAVDRRVALAQLDPAEYEAAYAAGQALSLDEAIVYAQRLCTPEPAI